MDNKYAEKKQKKAGAFEAYMREPREQTEEDVWQLIDNNIC
jgi:hypothetical protein